MLRKIIITLTIILVLALSQKIYVKNKDQVRLSPRLINYQGYLTDTLGIPITNPALVMTFSIYDAQSGGNLKWTENQMVSVSKGIFNVILGINTPIPDSVFNSTDRWLELSVSGQTLTPRTRILSTAYAYTATYSDTAQYAKNAAADNDWVISGSDMYSGVSGNVGIGTTGPGAKLDVAGHIWQTSTGQSVFLGQGAGQNDDLTYNNNVFVGYQAGYNNTTGYDNTALGYRALYSNTTGTYNTAVGSYTATNGNCDNTVALGYLTDPTASNRVHIGNTSITWIGGQVTWSTYSDARAKTDVRENIPGLDFIMRLKPVSFKWDTKALNQLMGVVDTAEWRGKYDIEKKRISGFLAQDVARAARECNYDFSGIDSTANVYSLSYAQFVVPLVKAVQEQQAQIEKQQAEIEELKAQLKILQERMGK